MTGKSIQNIVCGVYWIVLDEYTDERSDLYLRASFVGTRTIFLFPLLLLFGNCFGKMSKDNFQEKLENDLGICDT